MPPVVTLLVPPLFTAPLVALVTPVLPTLSPPPVVAEAPVVPSVPCAPSLVPEVLALLPFVEVEGEGEGDAGSGSEEQAPNSAAPANQIEPIRGRCMGSCCSTGANPCLTASET